MKTLFMPILSILLISQASASPHCQPYRFLKPNFDINNMQACKDKLNSCPKTGPVLDAQCVKKTAQQFAQCEQTVKLAKQLKSSPEDLTAEKSGNFIILTQRFIADGKQSYYIISPKHCILDLSIQLKNIDNKIAHNYKAVTLLTIPTDKPVMETDTNTVNFSANYKVTKDCLACEQIGDAQVRFTFLPTGEFKSLKLINFNEKTL